MVPREREEILKGKGTLPRGRILTTTRRVAGKAKVVVVVMMRKEVVEGV